MKTKYAILMMAMGMSAAVMAQENDDMYFNSKDRVVANKVYESVMIKKYQQEDLNAVRSNPVNPSDSYTGRGVNPEYNAQIKNGTSVIQDNPDYFLTGYQPKNINSSLYSGNSAYPNSYYGNGGYNNGYYNNRMGYGGMGYSGMGMGYSGMGMGYGGFGSPFGYYSPYSSMMMGYGFGGYGSGFYGGMGYGMGSMFGSPFYSPFGMNSFYSPYSGYGGYGGYGYPYGSTVVINNGDSRSTVNGRHPSRSDGLNNYVDNNRNDATITGTNGRVREGGRTRADSQTNYYDRGWKNNSNNFPTRSYYDNNSGNSRSGYSNGGNNNNSSWGDSGGRTRSSWDSFGSGSRSSFGGGGFSGGSGGSSGGGGGGHSRGRN